jgi:hypothetical protein
MALLHALRQGQVVAAMGRAAVLSLRGPAGTAAGDASAPGPWVEGEVAPRADDLVRAYVRHVGGDAAFYRGRVPAHLFPQWAFPFAARAMAGLPYPLVRVINAGCRIEQRAPIQAGERLVVRARLEQVSRDERRALLTTRIVTGTRREPEAVVADLRAYVPLARGGNGKGNGAGAPLVPEAAKEVAFFRLSARAGLEFAELTGDFNPVHWVAPYARAAGFRGCILHGFSTLARAVAALDRARFAGDPLRLAVIDARFTRPLVLPARAGVYVQEGRAWVGDAPGGTAYLDASFLAKEPS